MDECIDPEYEINIGDAELQQSRHWASLTRSFNKDFIKAAKEEHDRRKRLQMA